MSLVYNHFSILCFYRRRQWITYICNPENISSSLFSSLFIWLWVNVQNKDARGKNDKTLWVGAHAIRAGTCAPRPRLKFNSQLTRANQFRYCCLSPSSASSTLFIALALARSMCVIIRRMWEAPSNDPFRLHAWQTINIRIKTFIDTCQHILCSKTKHLKLIKSFFTARCRWLFTCNFLNLCLNKWIKFISKTRH